MKIEFPYDPAIPLLGINHEELRSAYYGDTCIAILITALFTIAKLWNQPRCPSTDEQIKKMWYVYSP
jgi:hypothetical protein